MRARFLSQLSFCESLRHGSPSLVNLRCMAEIIMRHLQHTSGPKWCLVNFCGGMKADGEIDIVLLELCRRLGIYTGLMLIGLPTLDYSIGWRRPLWLS
jgi:hypothetical protein